MGQKAQRHEHLPTLNLTATMVASHFPGKLVCCIWKVVADVGLAEVEGVVVVVVVMVVVVVVVMVMVIDILEVEWVEVELHAPVHVTV